MLTKSEVKSDVVPFHKGCEMDLVVGNFSVSLKSTKGDSAADLLQMGVNVYLHILAVAKSEVDLGIR